MDGSYTINAREWNIVNIKDDLKHQGYDYSIV